MVETVRTAAPRREQTESGMRVIADVAGQPPLWFEVEAAHAGLLSERADHVAIGLLLPAMRRGRDLHIGGEVTDVLLYQLNNDLQGLLRLVYPACNAIRVTADATAAAGPMPQGVATGFSAGVDSFAVLTEFALSDDVPEPLRITHLLNNNVGAHGQEGRDLWRERCIGIRRITDELGLPLVTVDSNLDDFYPDMGFLETVTFRNATVPHLLGAGIGRFYSASGYSFEHIAVAGHQRAARVDPISLPLMSTPSLALSSANPAMSRVEKTVALVGRPQARFLDVCVVSEPGEGRNCSSCWKCMRTMLTLEIAGHLDEFIPEPFRLEPYLERRDEYIVEVLASDSPLDAEVVAFAAQTGWDWGREARSKASVRRTTQRSLNTARRARRRWKARRRR